MFYVVHVYYNVVFEVRRNQTVDHLKYRVVKNGFGEDVVVHLDYKEHRLVTIDLEDDVVVHVDHVKYSVWSRMTLDRTS